MEDKKYITCERLGGRMKEDLVVALRERRG